MLAIANPPRLREHQHALIDLWSTGLLDQPPFAPSLRRASFFVVCRDRCQFGGERCICSASAGFCGRNPRGYCRGCRAAAQPEIQSGCASTQPEIVKIESDLRLLEMRID